MKVNYEKKKLYLQDLADDPWRIRPNPCWSFYSYAFVNALSYVNTTAADKLLLQKIVSGEVATQEASVVFAVWGAEKVPTVPVLDYLHVSYLHTL